MYAIAHMSLHAVFKPAFTYCSYYRYWVLMHTAGTEQHPCCSHLFPCSHITTNNRMNSTVYTKTSSSSSDRAAVGNGNGADKSPEQMLRSKILAKVPTSVVYAIRCIIVQISDMQCVC